MAEQELLEFLGDEKAKLFKARDYIDSYYQQIAASLETLRDNIIPYSFSAHSGWKDAIDRRSARIQVPDVKPQNLAGDPAFNSVTLLALINNIVAVRNTCLAAPESVTVSDIRMVRRLHQFLLSFIEEQYSNSNLAALKKQQRDLAFSVKQNIEKRVRESLDPFFSHLEMILDDEYRVTLAGHAKLIVESLENYKQDPARYDELIARKCRELGLKSNPEHNLAVIADLDKPASVLAAEVKAKYEPTTEKKTPNRYYRMKEIALRYCSQAENLEALIYFLRETERNLLRLSLWKRLGLFFRGLFSSRRAEMTKDNISFSYVGQRGKIERKRASLNDVVSDASFYWKYLLKFKEDLETESYSRTHTPQHGKELDKFIETSFGSLGDILERCQGFRNWLGRENNRRLLRKIPDKRQEDFNNLLLHLNRTCIVNNFNLQEFDKFRDT